LALGLVFAASTIGAVAQGHHKSFVVSTYAIHGTVQNLMNGNLDPAVTWSNLTRNLKIDKIYLEVMRNYTLVDEAGLAKLKKFYQDQGVEVCGGLAYSVSESYGYQGFDYADPEHREFVRKAAELAARHFDEILLDDYYFFNRKTDHSIKAKGRKSWTQYRLEAMRDVTENLIIKPVKAVNPKCKVIIKMANWYDQYAGMGNDTKKVPLMADGMFSGTESRLWFGQEQHLQPYLSYNIMRFMDNLKPGVNKGGWVDQGGANPIDRYSEQLLNTVFARCPEMCCFHYGGMLSRVRTNAINSRTWADEPTSLNLADLRKKLGKGEEEDLIFADIAAYSLGQIDPVLANVGKPVGIKTYTPYHATGEEFLHDYLGMIGLPMDILPHFPSDADMVLLTEQAKFDRDIIRKIKNQLKAGKSVCVTSGFVSAMKGKGLEEICELEATGATVPVRRFAFAGGPGAPFRGARGAARREGEPDPFAAPRDILIPEIKYFNILTHDAWGDALGISPGGTTYPVLLSCDYSKGKFYVLTIPNDPADLYSLPTTVLSVIRAALGMAEPVRIDNAPAQVALFRYDNDAFIVQNYLPAAAEVTLSVAGKATGIRNLLTDEVMTPAPEPETGFGRRGGGFGGRGPAAPPERTSFKFTVLPHSYLAFATK
jgi:hypothetical protein